MGVTLEPTPRKRKSQRLPKTTTTTGADRQHQRFDGKAPRESMALKCRARSVVPNWGETSPRGEMRGFQGGNSGRVGNILHFLFSVTQPNNMEGFVSQNEKKVDIFLGSLRSPCQWNFPILHKAILVEFNGKNLIFSSARHVRTVPKPTAD